MSYTIKKFISVQRIYFVGHHLHRCNYRKLRQLTISATSVKNFSIQRKVGKIDSLNLSKCLNGINYFCQSNKPSYSVWMQPIVLQIQWIFYFCQFLPITKSDDLCLKDAMDRLFSQFYVGRHSCHLFHFKFLREINV